ncbi:hypothetical protein [Kibdelosporangium aridum]|uniref:LuxR family transcriptional regulator n=1 Tax=Kibdelosporangium aridum TaxID=2030 RepID=A0A1W2FV42_KIBAR|nr:hypothetical protein [Kibdelosporangium aridum]SMD25506.1 hypothetical protein SAMN05661093_09187 [Kibdelosporangium aridum]
MKSPPACSDLVSLRVKEMVADKMGVSTSTVNTYLDRVRIKYANAGRPAATKAALLARAIQDGLIGLVEL